MKTALLSSTQLAAAQKLGRERAAKFSAEATGRARAAAFIAGLKSTFARIPEPTGFDRVRAAFAKQPITTRK